MSCLKSHGCQPNCMFGTLCMFRVLLAPIFSQILLWMGSITWTCYKCMPSLQLLTSQTWCSSRMEPLHIGPGMSGVILTALLRMPGLDMEALLFGPPGLKISHLWTCWIVLLNDGLHCSPYPSVVSVYYRIIKKKTPVLIFMINHSIAYIHRKWWKMKNGGRTPSKIRIQKKFKMCFRENHL